MILESIFKLQRITGDKSIFQKSCSRGKAARNARRSLTRKSQKGLRREPPIKKYHVVIADKVKAIVENGEIFLLCRKGRVKAPFLNFRN